MAGEEVGIDPEYVARMRQLAGGLDYFWNGEGKNPRTVGFCLFVFPLDMSPATEKATGRINYISNANRDDMVKAVEEWLLRAKEAQGHG